MNNSLSLGIDLGSDTIKIAFAYTDDIGVKYGKFDNKPLLTQIALPSLAYYDTNARKWFFGDEIAKSGQSSFITVVKIKSLISLLVPIKNPDFNAYVNESMSASNAHYYNFGEHFPKFFFPARRKMLENYEEMIEAGNTFVVSGHTPKSVCEQFFYYIEKIVSARINELSLTTGLSFEDYQIAIVHPTSAGEEYIHELSAIVQKVFNRPPHKALNSNKALAVFAEHKNAVGDRENFLVFDMAEEDISVARIGIDDGAIIIDGKDGHNDPVDIGGIDVDEAICKFLLSSTTDRETIGTPTSGQRGHINETGVYSKQYQLMKDIKKAKIIFSKPLPAKSRFNDGVPVTLAWDVLIQRLLTKEDVKNCIGVSTDSGIARDIYDYILTELTRPMNYNVHKIFISGGLTETYSLCDYIAKKLKQDCPNVEICSFEDYQDLPDGFNIRSFEDAVFAPAVGGAIASLLNKDIEVVLSLSYATWAIPKMAVDTRILRIFANRGEKIGEGREFTSAFSFGTNGVTDGEELFSTFINQDDINMFNKNWNYCGVDIDIGNPNSFKRQEAQRLIDLKTVSGGENGFLTPMYMGNKVTLADGDKLHFIEGISVNKEGRAHPIVRNNSGPTDAVRIIDRGIRRTVRARDIQILTNLTDFDTSQG